MANGLSTPAAPMRRPNKAISTTIAVIAVLVILAPVLIGVYTDWLWFGEVDFRGVFTKVGSSSLWCSRCWPGRSPSLRAS